MENTATEFNEWMKKIRSDYYSDDEMEDLIAAEEGNLNEDVKKTVLTTLLVAAGIEIMAGG